MLDTISHHERSHRASRAVTTLAALVVTLVAVPSYALAQRVVAPVASGTSASAALDDPTIVAIFDAANTWDIETGNLAAARGATPDVRQFGRMLVHDHTVVRQQGRDLAAALHVTPTPPANFAMATAHAAAMTHLRSLQGAAFDTAFLHHEVTFHKAVLDAVTTTLLPATQNAQLRKLETTVAPAFQAHMMRAQQLFDAETHAMK